MRYFNLICIFYLICFLSCKNEKPQEKGTLVVQRDGAELLAAAGNSNTLLRPLQNGELLEETGAVSPFVTPVQFGNITVEAPWVRVADKNGQTGWVFAGHIAPVSGQAGPWLQRQKLMAFFGPAHTDELLRWSDETRQLSTAALVADVYWKGIGLRDTLTRNLHSRAEPNEAGFSPDFFWLNELLTGFLVQYIPANDQATLPYWFADYGFWYAAATQTESEADDSFFEACIFAFPADSIESPFPSWTIQTDLQSGCSQLGLGRHYEMLRLLDKANNALFAAAVKNLKDSIVEDIVNAPGGYWQTKEKILTELNFIINERISILDEYDQIALTKRRDMFLDPVANGIAVDLRSGGSDPAMD